MLPQPSPSADRRIPIEGTYNFRDVGGYPSAGGGTTRWGQLYRSDNLAALTDAGRAALREVGLRRVIDLRSEFEVEADPSLLDGLGVRIVQHPIFSGSAQSAVPAGATVESLYTAMIEHSTPAIVAALKHIAEAGDEPVLVHCTAGKDRTGVTIALALLAVGVDRETVVAEYALTADNLAGEWVETMTARVREYGVEPDAVMGLLAGSPASAMNATIDRIEAEHGSVAGYLEENGFTTEWVERLRHKLVVGSNG